MCSLLQPIQIDFWPLSAFWQCVIIVYVVAVVCLPPICSVSSVFVVQLHTLHALVRAVDAFYGIKCKGAEICFGVGLVRQCQLVCVRPLPWLETSRAGPPARPRTCPGPPCLSPPPVVGAATSQSM